MKIKLIIDPWAGGGRGRRFLSRIVKILGKGNLLDVSLTQGPKGALLFSREAAQNKYDIIVAGCGDGTLNEVINGMLRMRSDLPLGFIPLSPLYLHLLCISTSPFFLRVWGPSHDYVFPFSGLTDSHTLPKIRHLSRWCGGHGGLRSSPQCLEKIRLFDDD